MKIRRLEKNEIALINKIVQENYPSSDWIKDCNFEFEAMFSDSVIKPEYFVVEKDNEIMGFAGFCQSWMDYDIYEIFWVNIKHDFHNKGIGKFLINELIKIIKNKKGARLVLLTAAVVKFYEKFGFKDLKIFDVGGYKLMYLDLKR